MGKTRPIKVVQVGNDAETGPDWFWGLSKKGPFSDPKKGQKSIENGQLLDPPWQLPVGGPKVAKKSQKPKFSQVLWENRPFLALQNGYFGPKIAIWRLKNHFLAQETAYMGQKGPSDLYFEVKRGLLDPYKGVFLG